MAKMFQWNRVLKLIRDAPNSAISIYDLAEKLATVYNDESLEMTLTYLQRRGSITKAMGVRSTGKLGLIVTLTDVGQSEIVEDPQPSKFSRRDELD